MSHSLTSIDDIPTNTWITANVGLRVVEQDEMDGIVIFEQEPENPADISGLLSCKLCSLI